MAKMSDQCLNLRLVQEVEKYPCLYNCTLNEYSRKDINEKAWSAVGKELNLSASECKEKWQNLRAVFVRHMKAAKSGTSSKFKRPYYLADAMQFALPYVKSLNTPTSPIIPPQSGKDVYNMHEDDKSVILKLQAVNSPPSPESVFLQESFSESDSLPIQSPQSYTLRLESPQPPVHQNNSSTKRRYNENSQDCIDENFDEYLKAKKNMIEANADHLQEANKMFLLSLLPDVNQMSSHQTRMFKRKVIELIDDILQNTKNPSINSSS